MTSKKQIAANQDNAKKSTGPKSDDGKIQVAGNAIKHGILSQQLVLPGEDQRAFIDLQDDLRLSLKPVGTLELILVEKIASVIWKQKRLAEANSASIQLVTRSENYNIQGLVGKALGCGSVSAEDLIPLDKGDRTQIAWCRDLLTEYKGLDAEILVNEDLSVIAEKAPLIHNQLYEEAEGEEIPIKEYLETFPDGIIPWIVELTHWCRDELKKYEVREKIPPILKLVQRKETAHMGMELMNRYQTASDNELYRAMDALRKQQEWRQKNGIDLKAEVEVA